MRIPMPDALQVAPREAQMPSRSVTQPGGFESLERAGAEAGQAVASGVDAYDKQVQQLEAKDIADRDTQLRKKLTDRYYGGGGTQNLTSPDLNTPGPGVPTTGEKTVTLDMSDTTLGQQQPSSGFLQTRGEAALKSLDDTISANEEDRRKLAEGLSPRAKEKFLAVTKGLMEGHYLQAKEHVAQQLEVAKADSLKASLAQTLRDVAYDPANGDRANAMVAQTAGAAEAMATSPKDAEAKVEAIRSEVAATRTKALLDMKNYEAAQKVVDESRHSLGLQAADFDRAIAQGRMYMEANQTASEVVGSARKPSGFIDEAKAGAAFEALDPKKKTKDAQEAFSHLMAIEKQRETSVKSDNYDAALSAYLQRHNLNDVPPYLKAWMIGANGVPGNDPKSWDALERVAHAHKESLKGAGPNDDQIRAFVAFDTDIKDHPDRYATMSSAQFNRDVLSHLAKKDWEKAGEIFAGAHGKNAKPGSISKEETDMLLEKGRDSGLFGPKGKDPAAWSDDQSELYYTARQNLEAQSEQYRKMNGKPPPFELVKQWTDSLMIKGKVRGSGIFGTDIFSDEETALEALQKKERRPFDLQWTNEQKAEAAQKLKTGGLPVNDVNVDTYLRRRHGLQSLPTQEPNNAATPGETTGRDVEVTDDYGLDLSNGSPDGVTAQDLP